MNLDQNFRFIKNDELKNVDELNIRIFPDDIVIYEVVRVIEKKVLFIEDHLDRFFSSCFFMNLISPVSKAELKSRLHLLIDANCIEFGNIKFQLIFRQQTKTLEFFAFSIPHYYPTEEQYHNGVSVTLFKSLRTTPNAKVQHKSLIDIFNQVIEKEKVYEVIMVHPEGYITEGSKSNLFMIKGKEIYTAQTADVLPGITRKYIIQVCRDLNLPLCEKRINCNELLSMDALFITGTSPKVLPIRNVNNNQFDITHPVLRLIMESFDELIEQYLRNYSRSQK